MNAAPPIRGQFDVAITCNSHLRVKLDGDAEAWRRRVMIVTYERPKPEVRISRFAEELLSFCICSMQHLRRRVGAQDDPGPIRQTARAALSLPLERHGQSGTWLSL